MRNRPWALMLLALIQILTPVFNVFFNAWVLQVSPAKVLSWVLEGNLLEIFEFAALMPIAGIAIWRMRKWSYGVFCGAMAWSLYAKFRHLAYAQTTMSLPMLIAIHASEIALVTYFLLPAVRATYFDPRVRWWESKPRYELKLPAQLVIGQSSRIEGAVLNLSEGGAFVQIPVILTMGEQVRLEFSLLTQLFAVAGKVVHVREAASGDNWHGIQFQHDGDTQDRFRKLARALGDLGFQDRVPSQSLREGFRSWVANLRRGRGWVPEVKSGGKG